ncbi:sensor histidine kinase [Dactylosporangium sp. CS-033363]|uniref:sensor histidine kinase n=1 Tax=Dactylosporangium sp. CS-033363 TaxID=3239935 RepID=UPI003D8B321B
MRWLGAMLLAAGFLAPWFADRPDPAREVIWQLVMGTGCTTAAWILKQGLVARLMAVSGGALAGVPVLTAAGLPELGAGLFVAAVTLALPAALLAIGPRVRALEPAIAVAGVVASVAAVVGAVPVEALAVTGGALFVLCAAWVQFERTAGVARRRLLWVFLGVIVSVPTSILLMIAVGTTGLPATALTIAAAATALTLPVTAAIAVLRPDLADVRTIMHRLVVGLVMFALAAAAFEGTQSAILAVTGAPAGRGTGALIAVAIAAGFHPVLRWVRTSMHELLFGGPADAVGTMIRLGSELSAGSAPPQWIDTLRSAVGVPQLVLRWNGDEVAVSGAAPPERPRHTIELQAGSDGTGELVVAVPAGHLHLAPKTAAVLRLVAAPLAQALHAGQLAAEVRESRGWVVAALEEDRRRMRHDLHDGLGPTLTGVAYGADAAANLVRADPDAALQVLAQLRRDTSDAIAEVRRIVYGLRPQALDDLGLEAALRQQLAGLRARGGNALQITFDVAALPRLPAAVEVAAYRIAVEAVTNVARHAARPVADVELGIAEGPALRLCVRDREPHGAPWTPGVGLESMRERAEQIGGTLSVEHGAAGSTVTAVLPLEFPESSGQIPGLAGNTPGP